ncbi:histidine kinase [Actinomyces massiliensis]|uniref:sensor histidine kinase n=1 Tax=Actinomyces massiliensis TaxID=461393 RepID=UPI0028E89EB1|nr:histidine kinase [Actinomyces massiliensis]
MSMTPHGLSSLASHWNRPFPPMSDQRVSIGIGAFAGLGNIALNAGVPTAQGVGLHTIDYAFMIAALVIITLLPLHPRWGALAYFFCWLLVLLLPGVYGSDVLLTNFAFFFFVGRFISVGYAVAILATTFAAHSALYLYVTDDASYEDFIGLVIYNLIALIFIPLGATVRASEQSRLDEARRAEERLEELRLEISREMHDLIAYSMSQTALRAQRAAADTTYPDAARSEFAALEVTAADALHELRLLLRTLRRAAPELALDVTQTTGLGHVVTDLGAAVRAVSDDIAAAGFDITYQCRGNVSPTRSQASTLSRVAREMGANVVRHAEPNAPVTMTLRLGPEAIRLVSTNRIRMTPGDLPHSGSGVLGMRERLTAIGGELTTLADDGAWIVTATVPVASTRAPLPGSES